ncbi:alpha/beta hydrolase [Verticiella sediminum]
MPKHAMNLRTQWIDLDETALRFEWRRAQDAPLVLVHELGGSLNNWDRVLDHLETARSVLRYDARGCGMSEKLRAAPGLAALADDIVRLLDALGIDEPVPLAGCALGGAVALACAARHPARVAAVVAMTPVTDVASERRAGLLALADRVAREGMRVVADGLLSVSFPRELVDAQVYDEFRARWLANDPDSFAWQYRMLAQLDMRVLLPRVRCPVLVVAAEKDALRPAALSEAVAGALPHAKLVRLAAGHFMPVQAAPEVAAAIQEFLPI